MNRFPFSQGGLRPFGRRRFVVGLGSAGFMLGLGCRSRPALATEVPPELSGSRFDLVAAEAPINITGRQRLASSINGTVPAPILRWRQGDTITLNVTNHLRVPASIHWHGIRVPTHMDGVPGLSFPGIFPGETFTYRIPLHEKQTGTYWYHSHSAFQEQTGMYGPLIIEPRDGYPQPFDRDYVVMLSDWSDEDPETIVSNLKFQSDYYNFHRRTLGTFIANARRNGLGPTIADRLMWGRMRMSPTDILDVTGHTYTYLVNGQPPGANWTALFRPGERVRLRFINGSSMTIFDVRIPGLKMTVVQADGNDVEPVPVDEFRISVAETYDVIVQPGDGAYTVFAQSEDHSGYARGTLAPYPGMAGPIPPMDPRPLRTMVDMGMGGMGSMSMEHGATSGMNMGHGAMAGMAGMGTAAAPKLTRGVEVDNVAMMPTSRIDEPGEGLNDLGRRVLRYTDLRATMPGGRSPPALARHHAAPDRQHGAIHLGFRRQEVFRGRTDSSAPRRARAVHAHQRHHDGAPDPSARAVERTGKRSGRVPPVQAHHQRQTRRQAELPRHRRRARTVGLPLPSALSHGDGHVPHRGGRMTGKQRAAALLCGGWLAVCAGWSARAAEPSSPQVGPLEYEAAVQPVMDNASYTHFLLDQFEGRFGGSGPEGRWDAQGWWGNDYDKFWVKTEGTLTDGRVEDGTSRRCAGWG